MIIVWAYYIIKQMFSYYGQIENSVAQGGAITSTGRTRISKVVVTPLR